MTSLYRTQLIGYVGQDAELRYTSGGTAVADFSVAVNRPAAKGGKEKEKTTWVKVVSWGALAEKFVAEYVKKGRQVYVEGPMDVDSPLQTTRLIEFVIERARTRQAVSLSDRENPPGK